MNKLSTAKKLIDQLHTYKKEIDQNVHVDILLNEACYSLKADLAKDTINSYYVCIFNLSTEIKESYFLKLHYLIVDRIRFKTKFIWLL